MRTLNDAWRLQEPVGPSVLTIGNFDGIHLGQRRILETVRDRARELAVAAAVVTFEPHPLSVLRPQVTLQRLTPRPQKERLLELIGVDLLAIIRFDEEFAATGARRFVEQLLVRRLGAVEIYVGSGFGFGKGREGNLALLERLGERHGFRAVGISEVTDDREVISSTRIRRAIREGAVELAGQLLGRPYAVTGCVVPGEGRGREQGWPTINIDADHQLLPADGVYASEVWIPSRDRTVGAVTNVGRRPTFDEAGDRVLESHLFDFSRELYGEEVELSFGMRLRGERKFPSADELVRQIRLDAAAAREYLESHSCSLVPTLDA